MEKNNKGITLITLVITIVVILILSTIATNTGIETIKSSEFTKFTTELKIMQTQVNNLYEKYQNNEKINGVEVLTLGEEIDSNEKIIKQAEKVFTEEASGITDKTGYKYYSQNTIKELKIEGINQEFFINIQKRKIVSYLGMEYKNKRYYTLEQLPDGLYNVEYKKNNEKPTFTIDQKLIGKNKYNVIVKIDSTYSGYVNKWKVRYKKQDSEFYKTSDNLNFTIDEEGIYNIQIKNGEIESDIKEQNIGIIQEGLIVHYDSNINTRKGNNKYTENWEDLSGNKNDGILSDGISFKENYLNFETTGNKVDIGEFNYSYLTAEISFEYKNGSYLIGNANNGGYRLYIDENKRILGEIYINGSYHTLTSELKVEEDKRYNVILTYDGNKLSLYINGKIEKYLLVNGKIETTKDNTILTIGSTYNLEQINEIPSFEGKIYGVRVYNRALSQDELNINYNVTS